MTLLSITRGDRATFDLAITDLDTGDPVDLTAMTLRFTAKRRLTDLDVDAVISKTEGDGITVGADPTLGLATLVIDAADTEDIDAPRTLRWDVQVETDAGDVRTPLRGRLAILGDATRMRAGS